MLKRRTLLQTATTGAMTWATRAVAAPRHMKWIAYYGQTADVSLDPGRVQISSRSTPPFKALSRRSAKLVRRSARICLSARHAGLTSMQGSIRPRCFDENPTWGTRQIDV